MVLPGLPGVVITCSKSAIDLLQLALFTLAKVIIIIIILIIIIIIIIIYQFI